MKKQKICIIGGSLTGLVTAISLSKLGCEIDLITGNINKNLKSNRTIAVSQDNLDFLNKLNIFKNLKKEIWSCSKMKLYAESSDKKFSEVFELNNEGKERKVLYMLENSKIMKLLIKKIRKIKCISIKSNKTVLSISDSGLLKNVKFKNNYNLKCHLVIICTGYNSSLIKDYFNYKTIKSSYKESAITTIINHKYLKNNIVRQIFLKNEIFALLPISNTKTSIVWSVKNKIKDKNKFLLKNKIKFYAKNFLKNINFLGKIEDKDLNFLIRDKYYSDRILLFGDALHVIHPFVGQGFNMTLRDLDSLNRILNQKINLGLDIGSSDILNEFSSETKPRNFVFSIGTNVLKNSFAYEKFRNDILKILNKNDFAKNIFFNIADKGLRF
tara:strand:+ start:3948 stop:5099 length:1152 start_codon:yes stop_codon:yes gene_type:complete